MWKLAVVAGLVMLAVPVAAPAMSVEDFLARADRLRAKGALALFSGDYKLLIGEVNGAGQAWRAQLKADQDAGRKSASCPPPPGRTRVTADDLLGYFKSLPPAERMQSVTQAFSGMMARRFPCK